jgi:hypothetical protein
MSTKKNPVVVVEGAADAAFARGILGGRTRLKEARGSSAAVSAARTLLILGHRVALILDADGQEGPALQERRRSLEFALGMAAPPERWCLVLVTPTLEQFLLGVTSVVNAVVRTSSIPRGLETDATKAKRFLGLERLERRQRLAKLTEKEARQLVERDEQLGRLVNFVRSPETTNELVSATA